MIRVMIVGPYGGQNLGDDLILEMILNQLKSTGCDIVVSCSNPSLVRNIYNVPTISLLEYRRWKIESLSIIKSVNAVIIGGGEQLSEPRVPNPLWGHLARTAHICRVARSLGIPVMLWAVGLDNLRSYISKWLVRNLVYQRNTVCCLRDEGSMQRFREIVNQEESKIYRVADPAYLLEKEDYHKSREFLFSLLEENDDEKSVLLLIPANDKLIKLDYISQLIELGKHMEKNGWKVVGWVTDLQPDYDLRIRRLKRWLEIPGFKWLPAVHFKSKHMAKIVRGSQFVISARMHPLIIAQTQNIPCLSIIRSAKMEAMAAEMGLDGINIEDLNIGYLKKKEKILSQTSPCEELDVLEQRNNCNRMQVLAKKSKEIFKNNILDKLK